MSVILMSAIIGTSVLATPIQSFADTKPPTNEDKNKSPFEVGEEQGKKIGEEDGAIKGKKDGLDGKAFDWEKAFISTGGGPDYGSGEYAQGFKAGYKSGFQIGYGNGYSEATIEEYDIKVIENIAEEMGIQDATSDYYNNLKIDEQRHRLTDGEIVERLVLADGDKDWYEEVFIVLYRLKYEDTYRKKYRELRADDFMTGAEEGKKQGKQSGEKDANLDFHNQITMNSTKGILTKEQAIARFNIAYESEQFQENFYTGYRAEYKEAYEAEYRRLRKLDSDLVDKTGYEAGKQVGTKQGEFSGKMDFVTPGKKSDWALSLKMFEQQKSITDRYFLDRESAEYKESFITGFKEAYRLAYHEAYTSSNIDIAENNINYENVAATGRELYFSPSDGVGNLGGALIIPEATFYEETHIGISMERDTFNYKNLKYKPVNHVYNVAVNNLLSSITLEKPMTLELDYYGSERAGIYQLVDGEWRYLYTEISNKSLTDKSQSLGDDTSKNKKFLRAEIPAGHFRGGKYAIFIDEEYKPIEDIKGHWAKEELYTYLRRGYIKGYEEKQGTLYHPNTTMKRAHFVELLGNVLGWDYEGLYDNSSRFKDGAYFGAYKDPINYAANMGYISGGTDGNFKPFDTITYQQVEWILRAVMRDQNIKWDVYEKNIKTDKKTQTESIKSKKLPIKRGEVVYMLYELQKENLI